ncbi:MAG: hypothetical protein QOF72_342 [Blastocatellia bacterium]|jgi:hypothetical protein|nr:hypothetical protein [Blastocatellia bacterium]
MPAGAKATLVDFQRESLIQALNAGSNRFGRRKEARLLNTL